jgi:nitrogen fixation protein FixH
MSADAAGAVHRGELVITLLDNAGEPLRGLDVTAALVRPTSAGFDTKLALEPQGFGEYRAEAALPLAGQWDVRVSARHGDDSFYATRRIIVQ